MAYTTVNKSTDYFNTFAYAGTGSTNTKTGVGFKPDWIWVKNRSDSEDHLLMDVLRTFASGKGLRSNGTDEEGGVGTSARGWVVATSDGFTTNSGSSNSNLVNDSGNNYVAWNWKANGLGSSNTDGSINTTYTSANTTSGFSIIQYTGNATAGATIGHGLGKVPKMIIFRRYAQAENWGVYFSALGNTKSLNLNLTGAEATDANFLNSTTPTSSLITLGTSVLSNASNPMIAYAFAEIPGFSKFGLYEGNGNFNGPFVYTGFKPSFIMVKAKGQTESWYINDNKRPGYNTNNYYLNPNTNSAEGTSTTLATGLLSNGFKPFNTDTSMNTSGQGYVYMAFAENPLVSTNGNAATAR